MKSEEYQEIYADFLRLDPDFKPIVIPIDPLPGEEWEDTLLRFLIAEEMVTVHGNAIYLSDRDKIERYDPNLLKVLDIIFKSNAQAELDALEEEGMVYTTVNDDGEIVYELTALGRETLENQ